MLFSLTNKLNKYLVQIIDEYTFPNFNKLFGKMPKLRSRKGILNPNLTIPDIIIKAFELGFKIDNHCSLNEKIIKINNLCDDSIYHTMKNENNILSHIILFVKMNDIYILLTYLV
jgi:hypothetical protein